MKSPILNPNKADPILNHNQDELEDDDDDDDDSNDRKFFKWKKVLVRSIHTILVLYVSCSLYLKNTGKRCQKK
jgi:hypothetical protein